MKAGDNLGNSGNINLASPEYARGYKKGYRNGHSIGFEAGKRAALEEMEDLGTWIIGKNNDVQRLRNFSETWTKRGLEMVLGDGRLVKIYALPVQKDEVGK